MNREMPPAAGTRLTIVSLPLPVRVDVFQQGVMNPLRHAQAGDCRGRHRTEVVGGVVGIIDRERVETGAAVDGDKSSDAVEGYRGEDGAVHVDGIVAAAGVDRERRG